MFSSPYDRSVSKFSLNLHKFKFKRMMSSNSNTDIRQSRTQLDNSHEQKNTVGAGCRGFWMMTGSSW